MTSHEFTLELPAGGAYRALAPDVARRFVEILGGSTPDVEQFAAAIAETVGTVAAGSPGRIQCAFRYGADGLEVTVRCDDRSSVVRFRLHAGTS